MPSDQLGLILDSSALIDFKFLNEWSWLQQQYPHLYISQDLLDSDHLTPDTLELASTYLTPLLMDSEPMLESFMAFQTTHPLLSEADRATLAIAQHYPLCCATDDLYDWLEKRYGGGGWP